MRASIIIPVYKAEEYIADCLESVLAQTVSDFEVICVDDGSPDDSARIVQGFVDRDPRVRLLRQDNGGASTARNSGFDASTGECVTFVDADDAVEPTFLDELMGRLERDDSDIAIGNKTVERQGQRSEKTPVLEDGVVWGADYKDHTLMPHNAPHAKLLRRDFLLRHGIRFYEGITYEDYIYWLECLTKNPKVSTVEGFVYNYKRNPYSISSVSRRLHQFNIESRIRQTDECIRIADESQIPGLKKHVFRKQYGVVMLSHVQYMNKTKDRESVEQAFQLIRAGAESHRRPLLYLLYGWKRLVYKIVLDGSVDDLIKLLDFVEGRRGLRVYCKPVAKAPHRFLISRKELPSIARADRELFDITEWAGKK